MLIIEPVERVTPIIIGQSLGGGQDIYSGKAGSKLQFNTIAEGSGINISLASNLLTITVDENDLAYASGIGGLSDVNTTDVADLDYLQYDNGSSEFVVRSKRETMRAESVSTTIPDNAATTLVTLDKLVTDSAIIHYTAYRESGTESEAVKQGLLFCKYRPTSDDWVVSEMSYHDSINSIGLSWSISSVGVLQYTASDYDDTSYTSHLKYSFISEIAI